LHSFAFASSEIGIIAIAASDNNAEITKIRGSDLDGMITITWYVK
jgi:hypothetical protein